ncbi:2-deoxy-D-gluconate 3-dehydrogenase [Massilia sp. Root133]|uniref:2-dehydro-3-deoxy-D-gluconate 5-dehydrogenase KduD n=1 Tax=Massilia cellulosiltytica TaxID=2683234 RepID=A0A7X3G263_9BURK|nr:MULTISPECIES: 2-dehydro-3-deoxy-D-gluconate 5-dehydrogenase KduD [Telluria group]KQY01638.1 2-deoxy-D-gluconate 3-dehydrogenase [Massilia sp. Root133]MVW62095.1 2-dehydro-3-deoxy-D-gluconate 5-dehydrogenase KduD [Telluria cellulosilytica]
MLDLFNLAGRTALVTGANTGLGQGIALALAAAGADVVAAGRSPADDTATQVRALGRRFLDVRADLSSTAPVRDVVAAAVGLNGRLDIVVNNAGIIRRADSLDVDEADWDAVIDTNLKSVFFLSQAAARHMARHGGGKIVNIASLLSFQGGVRVPAYAASKSAIAGITRALANEWAAQGINVNAIAPGYFDTNNTAALRVDPVREPAILARIPAGRWGQPADLAGAAVFLASRASDYVHGVVLPVDGGWLAR